MKKMNQLETLIDELNKIVGLLEVSDLTIFNIIKNNDRFEVGMTIADLYNNSYYDYRNHLCCSGLLLGFSFFESYAYDLLGLVLKRKPELSNHKVTLKYVIDNRANLFDKAIEDHLRMIGFTEVIKCLEKELRFFNGTEHQDMMFVYNIRNCIMHNGGVADDRVGDKFKLGEKISLTSDDVNGYGIKTREIAEKMWLKFNEWNNLLPTSPEERGNLR